MSSTDNDESSGNTGTDEASPETEPNPETFEHEHNTEALSEDAPRCLFCDKPPEVCSEHAQQMIAQAFSEDNEARRSAATRRAERELRLKGASNLQEDAQALAMVIRRWWRGEEIEVAKAILAVLEGDPT